MLLKVKEIQIPDENPFQFDVLNRQESAEALTEFVCSSREPMVICLNALWGQGKTTFFKMWKQHLKINDIPTIYFNAWENDFSDDALVCLLGEIHSALPELVRAEEKKWVQEAFDRVLDFGTVLVKHSLTPSKITNYDRHNENQDLSFVAENFAKEQVHQYERSKKAILNFREALRDFSSTISYGEKQKPLVFIIDELERCRPDFSIEVLEKIKHFFNVENIVFILGADKEQLGSSMKAVYGEGLNVDGYFQRFIDFDYMLPAANQARFVQALFEEHGFLEYFSSGSAYFQKLGVIAINVFADLFEVYHLSLREQKSACSLLSLAIRTTKTKTELHPIFLCYLIILKVKRANIYTDVISGKMLPIELLLAFRKDVQGTNISAGFCFALEAHIFCSRTASYAELLEEARRFFSESELDRMFLEFQRLQRENAIGVLGVLANKLEIISRFKG